MTPIAPFLTALAVATISLGLSASAQTAPVLATQNFDRLDYGILCFYPSDTASTPLRFDRVVEIFETDAGFEHTVTTKTLVVPAVPGLVIGVVSNLPAGQAYDVTSIITHTNLNGVVSPDRYVFRFNEVLTIDSWYMDASLDINQGSYRFQALRGPVVLYDVTLTIVPPEQYTGPYPDCISRS